MGKSQHLIENSSNGSDREVVCQFMGTKDRARAFALEIVAEDWDMGNRGMVLWLNGQRLRFTRSEIRAQITRDHDVPAYGETRPCRTDEGGVPLRDANDKLIPASDKEWAALKTHIAEMIERGITEDFTCMFDPYMTIQKGGVPIARGYRLRLQPTPDERREMALWGVLEYFRIGRGMKGVLVMERPDGDDWKRVVGRERPSLKQLRARH